MNDMAPAVCYSPLTRLGAVVPSTSAPDAPHGILPNLCTPGCRGFIPPWNGVAWCRITCTLIPLARFPQCCRPRLPLSSPRGLRGTTRPKKAVGSTWPKLSEPPWRNNVWIVALLIRRPCVEKPKPGNSSGIKHAQQFRGGLRKLRPVSSCKVSILNSQIKWKRH